MIEKAFLARYLKDKTATTAIVEALSPEERAEWQAAEAIYAEINRLWIEHGLMAATGTVSNPLMTGPVARNGLTWPEWVHGKSHLLCKGHSLKHAKIESSLQQQVIHRYCH